MFFSLFQIFLSNLIDINFDFKTLITDSFVVVFLGATKFCVFCGGNACFIILQWTRRTNQELVVEEWPWGELEFWKKYFMDFLLQNIFYCNMSDQNYCQFCTQNWITWSIIATCAVNIAYVWLKMQCIHTFWEQLACSGLMFIINF